MSNEIKDGLSPLVLFTFTRVEHTKEVLSALSKCCLAQDTELYIHLDAPRNELEEQKSKILLKIFPSFDKYFKKVTVIKQDVNLGCDMSMMWMMEFIFSKHDSVIVLEDDDVPRVGFLKFMNDCLSHFKDDHSIAGISGYCPPIKIPDGYEHMVFKSVRGASWGWATWKENWLEIDWKLDNYNRLKNSFFRRRGFAKGGEDMFPLLRHAAENMEIPHWDIVRCFSLYENNRSFIYPVVSFIDNIGFDGSGTNCGTSNKYNVNHYGDTFDYGTLPTELSYNKKILKRYYRFYSFDENDKLIVTIMKKIKLYDTAILIKNKFRRL